MPHLSPMNWLLAIILFWTTLALASSKSWWSSVSSMPFNVPSSLKSSKSHSSWKWNW